MPKKTKAVTKIKKKTLKSAATNAVSVVSGSIRPQSSAPTMAPSIAISAKESIGSSAQALNAVSASSVSLASQAVKEVNKEAVSSGQQTGQQAALAVQTSQKPSHLLSSLLFAVSIIFFVLTFFALKQAFKDPSYAAPVFFLLVDGILFTTAALYVKKTIEAPKTA